MVKTYKKISDDIIEETNTENKTVITQYNKNVLENEILVLDDQIKERRLLLLEF